MCTKSVKNKKPCTSFEPDTTSTRVLLLGDPEMPERGAVILPRALSKPEPQPRAVSRASAAAARRVGSQFSTNLLDGVPAAMISSPRAPVALPCWAQVKLKHFHTILVACFSRVSCSPSSELRFSIPVSP
jgi:hypothetical protein